MTECAQESGHRQSNNVCILSYLWADHFWSLDRDVLKIIVLYTTTLIYLNYHQTIALLQDPSSTLRDFL